MENKDVAVNMNITQEERMWIEFSGKNVPLSAAIRQKKMFSFNKFVAFSSNTDLKQLDDFINPNEICCNPLFISDVIKGVTVSTW